MIVNLAVLLELLDQSIHVNEGTDRVEHRDSKVTADYYHGEELVQHLLYVIVVSHSIHSAKHVCVTEKKPDHKNHLQPIEYVKLLVFDRLV